MRRSARAFNLILLAFVATFLFCAAAPALLYFEALEAAAPAVGGGLPGLFPATPGWRHPILILTGLALAGLACTWMGLRLANATLRESTGEVAHREARLQRRIDREEGR